MSKIEYGRYQMESHGIIICMIQNQKKNANVGFFFSEKTIVCFGEALFWRRLQVEIEISSTCHGRTERI